MQSKDNTKSTKKVQPSSVCSYVSCMSPTTSCRSFPNRSNEWRTVYQDSGSSDFLSQSIASSTSWSDELEGDLTTSLESQMQLVEHTLYRDGAHELSTLSPLREECRLWQQRFPHFRVLGQAVKPSVGCQTRSRHEEVEEQLEEIIASHGVCEDFSTNTLDSKYHSVDSSEIYKEKIKKAVIDQIFLKIWPEVVKKIEPLLCKAVAEHKDLCDEKSELRLKDGGPNTELTSGFNSLTLIEDVSPRPKSGRRSGVKVSRTVSAKVPVKPVILECSIPAPVPANRTNSPLKRSPGRLSLGRKHLSPERLLSPLPLDPRSGPTRRLSRPRPQYDARTGRMINREDSRPDLRRNLKTSPPLPWSRHGTLPPIETTDIVPKMMESKNKRSSSAFFKGDRLNSSSRPNTSVVTKMVLSPLDSLQIRQTALTTTRQWPSTTTGEQVQQRRERYRWRNRSNFVKRS